MATIWWVNKCWSLLGRRCSLWRWHTFVSPGISDVCWCTIIDTRFFQDSKRTNMLSTGSLFKVLHNWVVVWLHHKRNHLISNIVPSTCSIAIVRYSFEIRSNLSLWDKLNCDRKFTDDSWMILKVCFYWCRVRH